jgi:hypothetical protein
VPTSSCAEFVIERERALGEEEWKIENVKLGFLGVWVCIWVIKRGKTKSAILLRKNRVGQKCVDAKCSTSGFPSPRDSSIG